VNYSFIKRLLDVVGAITGLILLSPIILILTVIIWCTMGRPVLFRQTRSGLHGRPFTLLKFRTMINAVDALGNPLPDEQRLTRVGKVLRKYSLDEIPQLLNVLRGDMSLVGPRPLLMQYLDLYTPRQRMRHNVRPGITGWAQVNGRNAISWEEKFELDVWYVENLSIWLDLRIILLTLKTVIRREGISHEGHATMPIYQGVQSNDKGI
jgi:sugar transferase EpsL